LKVEADGSLSGHVSFVEFVERDMAGNPTFVYISEAGLNNSSGEYRHGIDGAVHKMSFDDFINRNKPVIGYIIPNPDFYS